MSEAQEKRYLSVGASLTMVGPSKTTYHFRSDQSLSPLTSLDEDWMEDMCVDRSKDIPPCRARLRAEIVEGVLPAEKVKESVFKHSHLSKGPNMSHETVHFAKSAEDIALEVEAKQATERLHIQQAITDEFLSEELLSGSISNILKVAEAYLLADFEEADIPLKQRVGNLKAFIVGDPQERKSLPTKVEDLINSVLEPAEDDTIIEDGDDDPPEEVEKVKFTEDDTEEDTE